MSRADDFNTRRAHLAEMSDEQLHARFWELAEKLVDPLLELGRKNTSPSVERSVLMRMGFSSMEAKGVVDGAIDRGLIGKGAGHVVYKLAKAKDMSIRDAGMALIEGKYWDDVCTLFGK